MKIFSYRLDIDSLYDLEVGVPKLLDLAAERKAPFSFFVNLGKAFNYYATASRYVKEFFAKEKKAKPGLREKIGSGNIGKLLLENKDVGLSRIDILQRIIDEGHELGLHGGMDHALWQVRLKSAPWRKIRSSFESAYERFSNLFGKPVGFTAPGFTFDERVLHLLDEFDFAYGGELPGDEPFHPEVGGKKLRHLQIPVTIRAEGNVGFKEWLHANGVRGDAMLEAIRSDMHGKPFAHIYSHPGFASSVLPVIGGMIDHARDQGYEVVTMQEIAKRWESGAKTGR
ncbi:MAG: polysaccharide deacetylase family protein [Candidatus Eisenbacteria bacterium]